VPQVERGHEFHFLRSRFVVFDTGVRAATPAELAAGIGRLTTGSVYFHFVEARRRPPLRVDDFSAWLAGWGPGFVEVRDKLAAIDFQLWTLGELRERLAQSFAALPSLSGGI
jgi:hypothetical protein